MAAPLSIMSLDLGEKRVGVAIANSISKLSSPLTTINRSDDFFDDLQLLVSKNEANIVVIGLPKNLKGEETNQTKLIRDLADQIRQKLDLPTYFEDETLSSVRAEETLKNRNKPYKKEMIDSLAACYILDDFLQNHPEVLNG